MKEIDLPIIIELYDGIRIHWNPNIILEDNAISGILQNGGGGVKWSTYENDIYFNASKFYSTLTRVPWS